MVNSAIKVVPHLHIKVIPVEQARILRDAVLRSSFPAGESIYPGDDAADTLHLGAFVKNGLVAVATVCHEALPGNESSHSWRLRGMATSKGYRGHGLGRALTEACIAYARSREGRIIWCSAREFVAPFYERLGFIRCGEPFRLPKFSSHKYVLMRRDLIAQQL